MCFPPHVDLRVTIVAPESGIPWWGWANFRFSFGQCFYVLVPPSVFNPPGVGSGPYFHVEFTSGGSCLSVFFGCSLLFLSVVSCCRCDPYGECILYFAL